MTTIPTFYLPEAQARVDKVNKRAAKLDVEGVTLNVSDSFTHVFTYFENDREVKFTAEAVEVSVTGPTVKLAGWTFLANIDHFEGLVRTTPDAPEGEQFSGFVAEAGCEHCHTDRDRKNTYVLRNENGGYIQVGSTCIKDFLGHDVNLGFLFISVDLEEEFEGFTSGGYGPSTAPLTHVLELASVAIRTDGWVPKSYDPSLATATTVEQLLDPRCPKKVRENYVLTDEDTEIANAARAWALEAQGNDYLFNLSQIAKNDFVTHRSMGLAVSMVSAYRRHIEKEIERKIAREAEAEISAPVPITDERILITGTITKVAWKEGYGYYSDSVKKITVRDDRGFKVWGTCPAAIIDADQGDRVTFESKVVRGDRDETFGFFKNPRKPAIINTEDAA